MDALQMALWMHLNKTSRWKLRQTDLLRNLDDVSAMDAQQTDMLVHTDTVNSSVIAHHGGSADRLADAQ